MIARGSNGVLVAQLGARAHYAVPVTLQGAGLLEHFYTDLTFPRTASRILTALPSSLQPRPLRRLAARVPDLPSYKVSTFPSIGWAYYWRLRNTTTQQERVDAYLRAGVAFCNAIIRKGLGNSAAVYAYNTAALELLETARSLGRIAILEQTIAPASIEKQLMLREQTRHPEWGANIDLKAYNSLAHREAQEWDAADVIVCGSQFVMDSIRDAGGPADKCVIIPYGVDCPASTLDRSNRPPCKPLRVLTVGTMGLRKGTPYIIEAAKRLQNSCDFRIVGPGVVPPQVQPDVPKNVSILGQVPRSEVSTHFEWADVFLLPSVCEGSAVSTYESLQHGVPVVCTPNTGSLVRTGEDGIVVPAGDVDAIVSTLDLMATDDALLGRMILQTQVGARYASRSAYGQRLLESIANISLP